MPKANVTEDFSHILWNQSVWAHRLVLQLSLWETEEHFAFKPLTQSSYSFQVHSGVDLIDLLLSNTDETSGCYSNQPWTIRVHDVSTVVSLYSHSGDNIITNHKITESQCDLSLMFHCIILCDCDWEWSGKESQPKELKEFQWPVCFGSCLCSCVGIWSSNCQRWCHVIMTTYPPLQTRSPEGSAADYFLDGLLTGSDTSSAPASPLWSPCTIDSSVTEDPLTDSTHSSYPPSCTAFSAFDTQAFLQSSPLENHLPADEKTSDVSIDLGKNVCKVQGEII